MTATWRIELSDCFLLTRIINSCTSRNNGYLFGHQRNLLGKELDNGGVPSPFTKRIFPMNLWEVESKSLCIISMLLNFESYYRNFRKNMVNFPPSIIGIYPLYFVFVNSSLNIEWILDESRFYRVKKQYTTMSRDLKFYYYVY